MTTPQVGKFTVDSTLDLPVDDYTAEMVGASAFMASSVEDEITLAAGYKDPSSNAVSVVTSLTGFIDQYELVVTPSAVRGNVRGRDKLMALLEHSFSTVYSIKAPEQKVLDDLDTQRTLRLRQEPAYKIGTFRASQIAADICQWQNFRLKWLCRDYTLSEDFQAVGKPLDLLRRLVEPWSQIPMFTVDIYIRDDIVTVKPRQQGNAPDATLSVRDARIKQLSVKKRYPTFYRLVTLQGQQVPGGSQIQGVLIDPKKEGVAVASGEVDSTKTMETFNNLTGERAGRVVTTTTTRMPDKIIVKLTEDTYAQDPGSGAGILRQVKYEETTYDYPDSVYDAAGRGNQPKCNGSAKIIYAISEKDVTKTFQVIAKEIVLNSYDDTIVESVDDSGHFTASGNPQGFLQMISTTKTEWDFAQAQWLETSQEIKTYLQMEPQKVQETTSTYKWVPETKLKTLMSVETQVNAGQRPGGKQPPNPQTTASLTAGANLSMVPLKQQVRLSTRLEAQDVNYTNANLSQEDLVYLIGQYGIANGMWEYEITLDCVAIPWLRKGMHVQFTGLKDANDVSVPLKTALIVSNNLNYDETGKSPSMTAQMRLLYWDRA